MRTLDRVTLRRVSEYIDSCQRKKGYSPSYREIMRALEMSSTFRVQRYVQELVNLGVIQKTKDGKIRMPKRLEPKESKVAPLVGEVSCGQPAFAEENIEGTYELPVDIFGGGRLFMLKAFGNSMIEAGINEGDILVMRQQNTAKDGQIVVALINDEVTLKRLYRKNGKIILHPENKEMKDIIVDNCQIQAVLVANIKMY